MRIGLLQLVCVVSQPIGSRDPRSAWVVMLEYGSQEQRRSPLMTGQQVAMIAAGCLVVVACVGLMATSRGLSRAIWDASWGKIGVPFRPRLARMGIIGAGTIGVLVGAGAIVGALAFSGP